VESDKNELFKDSATLAMAFPPCLSRKRQSSELDKHEMFMDWVCACDSLFPLPVEGKAIMQSDKHVLLMDLVALAMTFPPWLSTKRLSSEWVKHEIFMDWALRLRSPFPPPCRGKRRCGVGQTSAAHGLASPYRPCTITRDNAKKKPFPRQAHRKGKLRSEFACLRWPFPPACR